MDSICGLQPKGYIIDVLEKKKGWLGQLSVLMPVPLC